MKKDSLDSHEELKYEGEQETWLYKKIVEKFTQLILYAIIYIIVCIVICLISGMEAVLTSPIGMITSSIIFFVWIIFFL